MSIAGYACAAVMGLVLGLIGGGGSILTVPILVYLFGQDAITATGLSLFIVGVTSSVGAYSHHRQGHIHWRTAAEFGLASIITVFATRRWLVPALPDPLLTVGGRAVSKADGILALFALLMVLVAWSMIGRPPDIRVTRKADGPFIHPPLLAAGLLVGTITGMLGAGGGFLIIPALVLLAGLDMRHAVGTSLLLIAVNAFIGFLGDPHVHLRDHAGLLLPFVGLAIAGILVGSRLSQRIPNTRLRPAFGWFVLATGLYILARHLA
jgi:uncharacterized membrane protein YfcA